MNDFKGLAVAKYLHETINTTSANGKLMFHVFAALIEVERNLLTKRTNAGSDAARKLQKNHPAQGLAK